MATRTRTKSRTITNGPPRAVAYVRLSKAKSKPGDTEVGLETQLAGCERAILAMGGTIVAMEQDIQAGDRIDRPGLWRAIERIRAGEANVLIVYAIDRFGRDQVQQGVAIHSIRVAGGRLLSATENLEDGPLGDLMRSVYGFAGAVELEKNRERTNRALAARFQQTRALKPGHRPPYGYRKIGTGAAATYEADPAEAAIVRRIFQERAAGASIRSIVAGLTRDLVPSATGRGRWGEAMVRNVLTRSAYWTGEYECWRTCTVRDADNVPWLEQRPAEDRYTVAMPTIIDPALAARPQATAERNVWASPRDDRRPEVGLLRCGFARCATCGRAMCVVGAEGRPHYRCMRGNHRERPCPATASLAVSKLDGPFLQWLQAIIEDPSRAEAYRVERTSAVPDAEALAAAQLAERQVAAIEQNIAKLIETQLAAEDFAAEVLAAKLNDFNAELRAARAKRDQLAAACRATVTEEAPGLVPQDVLAAATLDAVQAMIAADPEPTHTFDVLLPLPGGRAAEYTVPLSWKAWQAALSVLGEVVTVAPTKSGLPRWVADVRPRGDVAVTTGDIPLNGYLGMTR